MWNTVLRSWIFWQACCREGARAGAKEPPDLAGCRKLWKGLKDSGIQPKYIVAIISESECEIYDHQQQQDFH